MKVLWSTGTVREQGTRAGHDKGTCSQMILQRKGLMQSILKKGASHERAGVFNSGSTRPSSHGPS